MENTKDEKKRRIDNDKEDNQQSDTKKSKLEIDKEEINDSKEFEKIFNLYCGIDVKMDKKEAKRLCMILVEKGHPIVKAYQIFQGWECEKDYEKSFELFNSYYKENKNKPEKQDIEMAICMYFLGGFYHNRRKNSVKGKKFYEKSAEMGQSDSYSCLGLIYYNGARNIEKDIPKAQECFEKGLKLNNSYCMTNLAIIYDHLGMKDKAIYTLEKAVEMDNTLAIRNLSVYYREGTYGIEKDSNKSIQLLERGVELEDHEAMAMLGSNYEAGLYGFRDAEKALELYKRASDLKNVDATFNLANYYRNHFNDNENFLFYLDKASDLGDLESIKLLSSIYENGEFGTKKDLEKTISYLEKGACLNDLASLWNLSQIYQNKKIDHEKSLLYLIRLFILEPDPENYGDVIELISKKQISWREQDNKFWVYDIDERVMTLLLISKHRNISKNIQAKSLIKGIAMIIIKYLYHFSQI